MRRCDVLVVGGGPAGSTCARELTRAGMDVVVLDRAGFPRDKPCAGWITPDVPEARGLDPADYARTATLQPIFGFETGAIGGPRVTTRFARPISYAIRRCEFDTWLLRRCGAEVREATPLGQFERAGGLWRTDAGVEAPMMVGAGGHFCPVARRFAGGARHAATVVAQEAEVRLQAPGACPVAPEVPELYFCRDLRGYGWCVRKDDCLNVGFGRVGGREAAHEARSFFEWLRLEGRVPAEFDGRWKGHAYRLRVRSAPCLVDDGVLLAGDAAGLAFPASGEGILPAVVSGLAAARAIVAAAPGFAKERLSAYELDLMTRLGRPGAGIAADGPAARIRAWVGCRLLAMPWFARRVLVPRWFLHMAGASPHLARERSSSAP